MSDRVMRHVGFLDRKLDHQAHAQSGFADTLRE